MYYNTLEEAKAVGMAKSKKDLKSYSIIKRNIQYKEGGKFYIDGTVEHKSHDTYMYCCHNYETPFKVYSTSPKSGKHLDMFPTLKTAQTFYNELQNENYRKNIHTNF